MIQAEFRICRLDGKVIEESEVYEVLKHELGEEDALKWTDLVIAPLEEVG